MAMSWRREVKEAGRMTSTGQNRMEWARVEWSDSGMERV